MKPNEVKHQFIELRSQGLSLSSIADKLNVSKSTLINWSKELSLEIENARQIEKDLLIEKYKVSSNRRLESLLKMVEKLSDEVEKRDFSELNDAKLIALLFSAHETLNKAITPIQIQEKGDLGANIRFNVVTHQLPV